MWLERDVSTTRAATDCGLMRTSYLGARIATKDASRSTSNSSSMQHAAAAAAARSSARDCTLGAAAVLFNTHERIRRCGHRRRLPTSTLSSLRISHLLAVHAASECYGRGTPGWAL